MIVPFNGGDTKRITVQFCIPARDARQCDRLSGNLEMSGNLTSVREMSGILLKVGELSGKTSSGKSCLKLFIVSCIFASIQVFSRSLLCIPTPTTDSNTSTGMMSNT